MRKIAFDTFSIITKHICIYDNLYARGVCEPHLLFFGLFQ